MPSAKAARPDPRALYVVGRLAERLRLEHASGFIWRGRFPTDAGVVGVLVVLVPWRSDVAVREVGAVGEARPAVTLT